MRGAHSPKEGNVPYGEEQRGEGNKIRLHTNFFCPSTSSGRAQRGAVR